MDTAWIVWEASRGFIVDPQGVVEKDGAQKALQGAFEGLLGAFARCART